MLRREPPQVPVIPDLHVLDSTRLDEAFQYLVYVLEREVESFHQEMSVHDRARCVPDLGNDPSAQLISSVALCLSR